jgi:hypothetical protein
VPPPEERSEIRQYVRTRVPQGRASVGDAGMKLLRVVLVVVVLPLLLLVVEFNTCATGVQGPLTTRSLRLPRRRRGHPRWATWPHALRMRRLQMPFASAALVEKN